jgi:hypothetical protein
MSDNIQHILDSWPFDPDDDLAARIITGEDGTEKLQMRVDLGVMQMELDGNPSNESPDGYETWFDYYEFQSRDVGEHGVDDYFTLSEEDCELLRREAIHFYYRYLCLMKLDMYPRVIRDTDRNLRLFVFIKRHAAREIDRWSLDQYRPYVIMMNTRAKASLAIKTQPESGIEDALALINESIENIESFYTEYNITSEIDNSIELSILDALRQEFLKSAPRSLEDELRMAVEDERFEDAARLRDRIQLRSNKP